MISFQFYLFLIIDESRYKTNCDFETAIPHYIEGVGGKYSIFRIGRMSRCDGAQYGIYFLPTQLFIVLISSKYSDTSLGRKKKTKTKQYLSYYYHT